MKDLLHHGSSWEHALFTISKNIKERSTPTDSLNVSVWRDRLATTLPFNFQSYTPDIQKAALAADGLLLPLDDRRVVFHNYVTHILRGGQTPLPLTQVAEELGQPSQRLQGDIQQVLEGDRGDLINYIRMLKRLAPLAMTFTEFPAWIMKDIYPRLDPLKQRILTLVLEGKFVQEICMLLSIPKGTLNRKTIEIRTLIEESLIYPQGYIRLGEADLSHNSSQANPIESVLCMRFRYTRPEFIQKYNETRRESPPIRKVETTPEETQAADPQVRTPEEGLDLLIYKALTSTILSPSQRRVAILAFENLSADEIVERLQVKKTTVAIKLSEARKIIENSIIIPLGFLPIAGYVENHRVIVHAANQKKLVAVKIFGQWYARPEEMDKYLAQRDGRGEKR